MRSVLARLRPGGRLERAAPAEPETYPWEANYPAELDWRAQIEVKPVPAILDNAAAAYADNPCLEFMGKRYDYKTVDALADQVAKGLQDIGVTKGDRIGLLLPNCPYY
ncbi:MAG: AMP-binding protein, partial [Alphaproteobacteria bacterium]|nr:AMP-binding protein [Alphaproteobacteria bacterium]